MSSASNSVSELEGLLDRALELIDNPSRGLPDSVFNFVLQVTPMVNVDLLVRDHSGQTLLAWREDEYGVGWHIPGGIVRWGEALQTRINEVARLELASAVASAEQPGLVTEFLNGPRGKFISLLFQCTLISEVGNAELRFSRHETGAQPGQLHWFDDVPRMLYPSHNVYRHLFAAPRKHSA